MTDARLDFIGFPPPLLGTEPVRLPVLLHEDGILALNRIVPCLISTSDLHPATPALAWALRSQIKDGKPELLCHGIEEAYPVYFSEPEVTGVTIFALTRPVRDELRDAFGSRKMEFRFLLLADGDPGPEEITCALPIARHRSEPRMLISRETGKRSQTRFRLLRRWNRLALWEARCDHLRPHQIRLHARECGIPVFQDPVYGMLTDFRKERDPPWRNRKGKPPRSSHPIRPDECFIHLEQIRTPHHEISAPVTERMRAVLKILDRRTRP